MNIQIKILPEPELNFSHGRTGVDPRRTLSHAINVPAQTITLGLVGLPEQIQPIRQWFSRIHKSLPSRERNGHRYLPFPGMETALRHRVEFSDRFVRTIDPTRCTKALARTNPVSRFVTLLDLYARNVTSLFGVLLELL